MHDSISHKSLKDQIRPFPDVATYPAGWAENLTFAQIMDDCTPLAATLIRKHGKAFQDFPDAVQRRFMVVWEHLEQDTQMFANADKYTVARIVEAQCLNEYGQTCRKGGYILGPIARNIISTYLLPGYLSGVEIDSCSNLSAKYFARLTQPICTYEIFSPI